MSKYLILILSFFSLHLVGQEYTIDPTHSFVQFKVKHLNTSWLVGRFNQLEGSFFHDAKAPEKNKITIKVNPLSIDSNHAERDKHLKNEDFLDVSKYTEAQFVSTAFEGNEHTGTLHGNLTLHGKTLPITILVEKIGEGADPWGGFRSGFLGTTTLKRADFGITYNLGPEAELVQLEIGIEGVRKEASKK